jgi:predicted transcriptional regulator
MANMLLVYDIPSYAFEKWEEGLTAAGWRNVAPQKYLKAFQQSDQAIQELTQIFKTLDLTLSEEDEEHVWLIFAGRDQQGNPQLGIKTLFGKKPG